MKIDKPVVMAAFLAAFFLGGCTFVGEKVAGALAKPVLTFAVEDAKTTNLWVDREVAAGHLDEGEATLARLCPNAVLALDALRTSDKDAATVEGKKGLIYYGVVAQFTKSIKDKAVALVKQMMGACAPLVPVEKLLGMF